MVFVNRSDKGIMKKWSCVYTEKNQTNNLDNTYMLIPLRRIQWVYSIKWEDGEFVEPVFLH